MKTLHDTVMEMRHMDDIDRMSPYTLVCVISNALFHMQQDIPPVKDIPEEITEPNSNIPAWERDQYAKFRKWEETANKKSPWECWISAARQNTSQRKIGDMAELSMRKSDYIEYLRDCINCCSDLTVDTQTEFEARP
jgi:hypothetical protein